MKKRLPALLLLLSLLLGLLAGCGGAGLSELAQELPPLTENMAGALTENPPEGENPPPLTENPPPEEEPSAPPEEQSSADTPADTPDESPADTPTDTPNDTPADTADTLDEDGEYTAPEDVALYLHTFGCLPSNFITKNEAMELGWDSRAGNLWDVAPGKSIGGDRFGNREGLLPKGRYYECDVNYAGGYRGSERLIYGEDGSIYYTSDHYQSFTQLY